MELFVNHTFQNWAMQEQDPSRLPAVSRWSRPGFVTKLTGKKPESFMIARTADSNIPIALNIGSAHMQWENGKWHNLNFQVEPPKEKMSDKELKDLERENAQLQVQCEILLHMLTMSELNKAEAQKTLKDLRRQIQSQISDMGVDEEYSEEF